jgi:DNA-binding CsgD family transcriptional regulator
VLTTFDADELVLRALQAGAAGFLLKDSPPADIVRAIDSVHAGDGMLSPRIARRLINLVGGDPDAAARRDQARQRLAALTPREREVAAAVADGSSNAEIATRLHMSLATVKAHVSRLLVKLDAANRVQIALLVQDAAAGRPRLSMTPDQPRRNGRSGQVPGSPVIVLGEHPPVQVTGYRRVPTATGSAPGIDEHAAVGSGGVEVQQYRLRFRFDHRGRDVVPGEGTDSRGRLPECMRGQLDGAVHVA